MTRWMRYLTILIILCSLLPNHVYAQEEIKPTLVQDAKEEAKTILIQDDAAGYLLNLPLEWKEISDPATLQQLVQQTCPLFLQNDHIPGATNLRGFALPSTDQTAPRLTIFVLDYPTLGLKPDEILEIAKSPAKFTSSLANALQASYLQLFPQSIKVNHHLGDAFFTFNLRSVLDFSKEQDTTYNRHLKVMLNAHGAVVLTSLYQGPPIPNYDETISSIVRTLRILPEQSIDTLNPPYKSSFIDYALIIAAILFATFIIIKRR